jgi:uncharacterized membrane protein
MTELHMTRSNFGKAIAAGLVAGSVVSLITLPLIRAGVLPMPESLATAFAQRVLGHHTEPLGLLLGSMYAAAWSVAYVAMFRRTIMNAVTLGLGLWVLSLVFFFPFVGWGFLGLDQGPLVMGAMLVPHLMFAVVLWVVCRLTFGPETDSGAVDHPQDHALGHTH